MRDRYIGEEVELSPNWTKSNLIWITVENWDDENGKPMSSPSMWFEFEGWIYYAIVDYKFGFIETHDDWQIGFDANGEPTYFNQYTPGEQEFNFIINFKSAMNKTNDPGVPYRTRYYKLDYEKAMSGDLDNWCQWEIEFTTKWNRDKKIKDIGI